MFKLLIKKLPCLILLYLFLPQALAAQEVFRFRGQVLEEGTGETIPYVTIRLKEVALGTISEDDGSFALKLPLKFASSVLRFSCVGYKTKEVAISALKEEEQNLVVLEVSIEELDAVTIENRRRENPLKVLKRALKAIPQNYPNENFTFDAYYREQLLENDAVIKFSDAATTIQQSGYDGNRVKRMNFKTLIKAGRGVMTGNSSSFSRLLYVDYLHDHFTQPVGLYDRTQIHDARASLNHSKEDFSGSIIEGPLALLSKDLVRYIGFITYSKNFRKYKFELLETPAENGEWDYIVKFSPKHSPASLESIRQRRKKGKRISRLDILSGEIRIDQKSYAIKQMRYFVSQDYRRHICNLQEMQVKHYGYNVDVDYWQRNGRWQIKRLHRVDEFIYKDTVRQTTTPYHAVTDLVVLDKHPTVDSVMMKNNFIKSSGNALYDFPLEYNPDFWEAYEAQVPEARLDERLRADMETSQSLEQQFSIKHLRNDSLAAPEAIIDTKVTELHGKSLKDDYHWMKDTKEPLTNERIMDYLREENAYTENYFRPIRRLHRELTNQLYELSDKESESDLVKLYGYFYWSKYVDNNEFRTIYRKKDEPGAREEVFIDITAMAEGKDYFDFGFYSVSPDNYYVAMGLDSTGSNQLTTYIQNIRTGALLSDSLVNTGSFIWAQDASGFFHSKVDKKTNRPVNIQFHSLGTPFESDSVYFSTDNPAVSLNIGKTHSKDFLIVNLGSNNADEQYIARNQSPFVFKKVRKAEKDAEYGMYHAGSKFYILTNIGAPNRRLMVTDTAEVAYEYWQELVPGSDTETIIDFAVFEDHLVLHKRENMRQRIEVLDRKTEEKYVIKEERGEIYSLSLGRNHDSQSDTLEYYVSAPNYKTRKVRYNLGNRKEKRTIESKDKSFFSVGASTKLIWVNARDGAKIPVSLVTWGRWNSKENAPLFVEAYGAYGASQSLTYNSGMEPLLEKGFVYAYVHVRGGGELGDQWYKEGKMMNKMNSFYDLIDAIKYLTANGYGDKDKVFGGGGSAGGLLMAAAVNLEPDLFQGVLLDFPFVDVINTMTDEALPLTSGEFQEWGNPVKKEEFEYMLQYSPYENLKRAAYPRMAFYAGFLDKNVGYWEAAKMVARLRKNSTSDNVILLTTDMQAGHGPSAGRSSGISFQAYRYALLIEWLKEVNEKRGNANLIGK